MNTTFSGLKCGLTPPCCCERACRRPSHTKAKLRMHRAQMITANFAAFKPCVPGVLARFSSFAKYSHSFVAAGVNLPKLESSVNERTGEDGFFVSAHAVGVADGVGGWTSVGIDAGKMSRKASGWRLPCRCVVA